jgi:hypothetical protein
MVEGYLDGVDTQGVTEGAQLYLSGTTAGAYQVTKPVAPIHLVYVGVAVKASAGNGRVYVKVQNGYELGELHDVLIVSPTNNQVLAYDSATQLWKNAVNAPDGVTSITAVSPLTGGTITSTGSIGLDQTALSITKSQVSDFTSGTVTSASTAQQAGTAVYAVNSGTAVYATTSGTAVYSANSGTAVTISGTITKSQVSDFTSGTVAQADNATTSGTALFANTSGTATYSTTSGTALTISGDITRSQVSDFTSGTVAQAGTATYAINSGTATFATNSGTAVFATNAGTAVGVSGSAITQSQVVNLTSDLAGKANLAGGNAFTGAQTVTGTATGSIVQIIRGASGQANDFFSIQNSGGTALVRANLNGSFFFGQTTGSYPTFFGASGSLAGMINVVPASAAVIPIIIRGAASQTADLFDVQNSSAVDLFSVAASGQITARVVANAGNQNRGLMLSNTSDGWQSGLYLRSDASGFPRLSLLAPTGALGEAVSIDSAAKVGIGNIAPIAQLDVYSQLSTRVGQVIRGAASQTADILQVQNSGGGNLFRVTPDDARFAGAVMAGNSGSGVLGTLTSYATTAATIGAVVRGAASQTANLQEWQNSAAGVLSSIGSSGGFMAQFMQVTGSGLVQLAATNSGGVVRITKQTAAYANPGANNAGIYFRDGTNAGTLKLVVRAGAAGAETTILDNIPQ